MTVSEAQANRFYSRVPLPTNLQGYVRYVVVLDPQDSKPYSIGIKYVCRSKGADEVLARLSENVNRRHKKRVHAWLCKSCSTASICPAEWACADIHVTPVGFANRRPWTQALGPTPRKVDGEDDEGWEDDGERSEGSKRGIHLTANGVRISAAHGAMGLNDDPAFMKSASAAASAESSQLANQLNWLNLDLNHMAKVLGEFRAGSASPVGPIVPPADFGPPWHMPSLSPKPGPSPLDPFAVLATSPSASMTSTGSLGTMSNTSFPGAGPGLSAGATPSAEASDVAQNMIGVMTSLNVIGLLTQLAGTLTDPGQLLLVQQLAAQIGTQIVSRPPEVEAPVSPNLLAGQLASLLGSRPRAAGPTTPEAPFLPPGHAPAAPGPLPFTALPSMFALPSMLRGVAPPAPSVGTFQAPGHTEEVRPAPPLSPKGGAESAWDLSKLAAAILPDQDGDLTDPPYATPPSATAPATA